MRSHIQRVRPGDPRLDRPSTAVATLTVLLAFAAGPARAAIVGLTIDPTLSFVSASMKFDVSAALGLPLGTTIYASVPQFPDPDGAGPLTGSNKTSLSGNLVVDIDTVNMTIGVPGGSSIIYNVNNTPGVGGVPRLVCSRRWGTARLSRPGVSGFPGNSAAGKQLRVNDG